MKDEPEFGDPDAAERLCWDGYCGSPDAASWIAAFLAVAAPAPYPICVADMDKAGCPLIYVNGPFCELWGYSRDEVLGRNCRFLQGPETEPAAASAIASALRSGKEANVRVTNYTRNGTCVRNLLSLVPITDRSNKVCLNVAFHIDLDGQFALGALAWRKQLLEYFPKAIGKSPIVAPVQQPS
eukprot:3997710-Pleurochrysis_carterae.AAC.1